MQELCQRLQSFFSNAEAQQGDVPHDEYFAISYNVRYNHSDRHQLLIAAKHPLSFAWSGQMYTLLDTALLVATAWHGRGYHNHLKLTVPGLLHEDSAQEAATVL